jgi:hypothetical protein
MKKRIRAEVSGPLPALFKNWDHFYAVEVNEQSENQAIFIFHDEKTALFEDFKTVVGLIEGLTIDHIRYSSYGYTIEDCQQSPLLLLQSQPRSGVGFTRNYGSIAEILRQPILPVFTQTPLNGIIVQTATEGWLFHSDLISLLNRSGLDKGLVLKPVALENQPEDAWLWAHSRTNLGRVVSENRFVGALHAARYLGEDFCTADLDGPPALIVSQPVYRLLSELPPDKICTQSTSPFESLSLSFMPFELI